MTAFADDRRAKIVATLGPASWGRETLGALVRAGVDVARLNFSHGSPDDWARAVRTAREAADAEGRCLAILADLMGPRIRVGALDAPRALETGDAVTIVPEGAAAGGELPVTYAGLAEELSPGGRVLMDDGLIELEVVRVVPPRVECRVVVGGTVRAGKGINLPGVALRVPSLTEKDLQDLEEALELEVDYVALSFVRRAADVTELRKRLPDDVLIVAKVEKDTALENLESILDAADALMVARGDLGAELPFERVPLAQKEMIRLANARQRPVITATQMLESMVERPRPTRAEVSDVANAVLDGTDAVMLSAETATGKHPVRAVEAMDRIIREIERSTAVARGPKYDVPLRAPQPERIGTEVAVSAAALAAVGMLRAPAIACFTKSGFTARVVSSQRPSVPVVTVTDSPRTLRQLALVWGVRPVLCGEEANYENMLRAAKRALLESGIARAGDRIVVTFGFPFHVRGTTNTLRIEEV